MRLVLARLVCASEQPPSRWPCTICENIFIRMTKRKRPPAWSKTLQRSLMTFARRAMKSGTRALETSLKAPRLKSAPPLGDGSWTSGAAMGTSGLRRFRLYSPPGVKAAERLPLLVMLHGCGQDANAFATSTCMNRIALRERFLVLYPEQDRLANGHGCWNWFDTASGRAYGEAALIMKAIDQVCVLHPVDRTRVAVAGLSAGASMAALLATSHPERFKAVAMHSGIPPGTAHSGLSALGAMHGLRATAAQAHLPTSMGSAWPPVLVIHGQADAVVSPQNGRAAAQLWADGTGATKGQPRQVQRGQRYAMSITDFKHRGDTVATLVEVARLGHAWSGGAANKPYSDAKGPDASRMVWAFVAKQFRLHRG
jgi:poly(hydroxyalkanoate) depolymerase family esterase